MIFVDIGLWSCSFEGTGRPPRITEPGVAYHLLNRWAYLKFLISAEGLANHLVGLVGRIQSNER